MWGHFCLGVIAAQSKEYTAAINTISGLVENLEDRKRHPFVSDESLKEFADRASGLKKELEERQNELLKRLTVDERLSHIESLFNGRTGQQFTEDVMTEIGKEGDIRFLKKIPPGYMDAGKSSDHDPYRKYGDLIIWKQLIQHAKSQKKPLILITDDSKEDWWLEQSGRTIGPRVELREEFLRESGNDFWMYGVDAFLEQSAKLRNEKVSEEVIAEVVEVSTESKEKRERSYTGLNFRPISEDEMLKRLRSSERWASEHDGFIGLHAFIHNYLGPAGYDFASCYEAIEGLEERDLVETYNHQGPGHARPVRAVRIRRQGHATNQPLQGLREMLEKNSKQDEAGG